jgi:hypothetical protein
LDSKGPNSGLVSVPPAMILKVNSVDLGFLIYNLSRLYKVNFKSLSILVF